MAVKVPTGTFDMLPEDVRRWEHVRQAAFDTFGLYGYQPIETPLFEQVDLFVRGIGESTDVVSKEIFHVLSSGNLASLMAGEKVSSKSRFALRPEGTASVVRSVIEHSLVGQGTAPVKLMYAGPMFRAERPQKGRYRQFRQFGVECLGATDPAADAEVIIMLMRFYERLGVPRSSMRLLLNSMGDDACRPAYRDSVRDFIHAHAGELCEDCNRRADLNPLRAFDCKNEHCHEVMEGAPKISDALCDDCREHYEAVKRLLDAAGIVYEEDPRLVRGLDYYTRTVFEVQVADGLGSQTAIGGGGRYDKLVESLGGPSVPGLGFAVGFERTLLALEAAGIEVPCGRGPVCYVACAAPEVRDQAFSILSQLRDAGIAAEGDTQGRSLKSQLKLAGKMDAPVCVVVGPDELACGRVSVRDMRNHSQEDVAVDAVAAKVAELL